MRRSRARARGRCLRRDHNRRGWSASRPSAPRHASGPRAELGRARAAFASIARLVDSLTTYARRGSPAPAMLDLAELVRSTLATFRHVVPQGVQLVIETESDLPKVHGVRAELEQLVLNLVLNACDAMPWGGKLWAIVEQAGPGELRLEITDTGKA